MKYHVCTSAFIGFFIFLLSHSVYGQLPYTEPLYSYDSIMDHSYGNAIDYAGNAQDLTMDIYTPVNDNCHRPIAVLVHGGAWVGGSKEDVDLVYLSRYLVKRGYVVANINYRLGTHKAANYDMYAFCNTTISAPCGYISDSAEVYRANYRAMQDVKGAIRYMKSRYEMDSTDFNNVFLVGQSAGGFISMTAAFMNETSEKPAACGAIADAPMYDPDFVTYGCIPNSILLTRPDLGSVEGDLHLGSFEASVQGVGNLFGGLIEAEIATPSEVENTALYQFHQGSDVVVNYEYGKLLGRMSWECYQQTNVCQPYYFYPFAYGSKGLDLYFQSLSVPLAHYQTDIIENQEYLNDCFDNGHSIDVIATRASNMVDIFAEKLDDNGNAPSTVCNVGLEENSLASTRIFPNPVGSKLNINHNDKGDLGFRICSLNGDLLKMGVLPFGHDQIPIDELSAGMYLLILEGERQEVLRFIHH